MEKIKETLISLGEEAKALYLPKNIRRLKEVPSSLVFLREYVMPNKPMLIEGGVFKWPALTKWTNKYLLEKLGDKKVTVALTPNGYADSPVDDKFVMPHEEEVTFQEFLTLLHNNNKNKEVAYLQYQNSSFTEQFNELIPDAAVEISWASEAFGKQPDAVNFWMGGNDSITSMHKDHYENIYAVVRGSKTFTLHSPTDLPCLESKYYTPARYLKYNETYKIVNERNTEHCGMCKNFIDNKKEFESPNGNRISNSEFYINTLTDNILKYSLGSENMSSADDSCVCSCHIPPRIPWIATDPFKPETYKEYSQPFKVTLFAGDLLYLPSLWFHHVQQTDDTIAVNFWYDMDYDIKYNYFKFVEQINNFCSP